MLAEKDDVVALDLLETGFSRVSFIVEISFRRTFGSRIDRYARWKFYRSAIIPWKNLSLPGSHGVLPWGNTDKRVSGYLHERLIAKDSTRGGALALFGT